MSYLAHAAIVDEARVAPSFFYLAPSAGPGEHIAPLIDGELHRKRSSAPYPTDSVRTIDCDFGALFALHAQLVREVGNAA